MLAFGILGDQARAETDAAHAVAVVHTDYVAQVSILTHLAEIMRRQGTGKIVVFSSVAGVGFAAPTTSTGAQRPAWRVLPAVWATRCTVRACS